MRSRPERPLRELRLRSRNGHLRVPQASRPERPLRELRQHDVRHHGRHGDGHPGRDRKDRSGNCDSSTLSCRPSTACRRLVATGKTAQGIATPSEPPSRRGIRASRDRKDRSGNCDTHWAVIDAGGAVAQSRPERPLRELRPDQLVEHGFRNRDRRDRKDRSGNCDEPGDESVVVRLFDQVATGKTAQGIATSAR